MVYARDDRAESPILVAEALLRSYHIPLSPISVSPIIVSAP